MFSDPETIVRELGVREGAQVADLGTGSGFMALAAARLVGESGKVFAVDVQQDLLDRLMRSASEKAIEERIVTVWGNLETVGGSRLRDNSIDIVIVANVLFQVEHKDDFFEEVKRIVKPGGTVGVVDWSESFGGTGPSPDHVVPEADARALAEKHGFTHKGPLTVGEHHYGFVITQ